jgi:tRNA nucleotidyltransferase (CCA-adding enzyme)
MIRFQTKRTHGNQWLGTGARSGSETNEIIGIVTRTDLISTLNHDDELPTQNEIAELLSEALPPARSSLLHAVADEAYEQSVQAFIVGGFVRDLLLKLPSQDFDIVIEGDAMAFAEHLARQFGGRVVAHRRFGTAKWILNPENLEAALDGNKTDGFSKADIPEHLDLISARTEFYNKPAACQQWSAAALKWTSTAGISLSHTLALRLDGSHFARSSIFGEVTATCSRSKSGAARLVLRGRCHPYAQGSPLRHALQFRD